jgi:hypothetical protein
MTEPTDRSALAARVTELDKWTVDAVRDLVERIDGLGQRVDTWVLDVDRQATKHLAELERRVELLEQFVFQGRLE